MGEKTEKASPKKLRDARKKGQVAKSQDLPSAFTFIVSIWIVLLMSGSLFTKLSSEIVAIFKMVPKENHEQLIMQAFSQSLMTILETSLPVLVAVAIMGVMVNFMVVGPMLTFEVFKFDIKKFDPIQNLKAKFKVKTLVELLKSVVKISIAGWIIYGVMYESLPVLVTAVKLPISASLALFAEFLYTVVFRVGLFFIVVAILDFAYQKHTFANEMKMEKFEVKQEYKNSEGDPHIKGKRKQIAQEIAYSDAPANGVKRASAVVTNPTHLAIAVAYNREVDAAPWITIKGDGKLAERLVMLAEKFNVPVVRNIKLAHRLWDDGDVHDYVPEDTYAAIAEIIRWVQSLESKEGYEYSQISET